MRILFVGAHFDDIELGAGGALIKHLKKGDEVIYVVISRGEKGGDPLAREMEVKEILNELNINSFYLFSFPDTRLYEYFNQIKDVVEKIVEKHSPVRIYTHSLKDYHQDHATVANAVKIAGRRTPQVLSFWSPSTYNSFQPEYFIDISEVVRDKFKILGKFKSQSHKDHMKRSLIIAVNKYFGYLSGVKYAEGFEIMRYREL
ncbi:MAG: PIG-L deacetylase family protein [Desulfurococcaceae archaeon]